MVVFGILVGFGIAYVRERTGLASDTVIGVFFAGAIGLAAMLRKLISSRTAASTSKTSSSATRSWLHADDLVCLGRAGRGDRRPCCAASTTTCCCASFNPSLALSRRVPVRLCNYLFVILLALIVNLCLRTVGVLLINALLIVPAATAVNLSPEPAPAVLADGRHLRRRVLGRHFLSWEVDARTGVGIGIPVLLCCWPAASSSSPCSSGSGCGAPASRKTAGGRSFSPSRTAARRPDAPAAGGAAARR